MSVSDPKLRSHSLIQSTHQKPTISTFFNNNITTSNGHSSNNASTLLNQKKSKKKNKLLALPLGGLGCVSSSLALVSASEFIRSADDWEAKKMKKKKKKKKKKKEKMKNNMTVKTRTFSATSPVVVEVIPDVCCAPGIGFVSDAPLKKKKKKEKMKNNMTVKTRTFSATSPVVVEVIPDVCCAPGIGFASDATLVDCVEPRRPVAPRTNHRERPSTPRRTANFEYFSALDSPLTFDAALSGLSISNGMQYRRLRHQSHGGLSEIMKFQSSRLLFGRNFDEDDRFGDWRLDVDNMSYEELLDLSERIGYVGTGLREDEIIRCLRKTKHSILDSFPLLVLSDKGWNCCICQEGCQADDEMGKLDCGHCYHINCIKQWLLQKNTCPICKAAAAAAYN